MSWFENIARFQISYSGAPVFAWKQILSQTYEGKLDLSCWEVPHIGAEVIPPDLWTQFERFGIPGERFKVGYGCAESVCAATIGAPTVKRNVTGCGVAVEGVEIWRNDKPTLDGNTGEIVLFGDSVCPHYWGQSSHLIGGRYHKTGDLGFILDGKLYPLGRRSEMLNPFGKLQSPAEIEEIVERDYPLKNCRTAIIRSSNALTEGVAIVREVPRKVDKSEVEKAAIHSIESSFEVPVVEVVLVPRGHLPKGSGGKVRRSQARKLLGQGRKVASVEKLPEVEIQGNQKLRRLCELFAFVVDVPVYPPDLDFYNSEKLAKGCGEGLEIEILLSVINDEFSDDIKPYNFDLLPVTPRVCLAILEGAHRNCNSLYFTPISEGAEVCLSCSKQRQKPNPFPEKPPLFWAHGGNGSAPFARLIKPYLPDRSIVAIEKPEARGFKDYPSPPTIEELARSYAYVMGKLKNLKAPIFVAGNCYGAGLAIEICKRLDMLAIPVMIGSADKYYKPTWKDCTLAVWIGSDRSETEAWGRLEGLQRFEVQKTTPKAIAEILESITSEWILEHLS